MAISRVCSLNRFFLSRGYTTRIAGSVFVRRVAVSPRHFASSSVVLQATTEKQPTSSQSEIPSSTISDALRRKNARSVVVQMVPKHAVRSQIEALFKRNALEIADIEMRLDRFSFLNDRYAFVELGSEQQVQQAVGKLNGDETLGEPIYVKPLKLDFEWHSKLSFGPHTHKVPWDQAGVSKAVLPLLEGRRLHIAVKTPGWGDLQAPVSSRNRANREIVQQTFSKFGIESIGPVGINWGDLKMRPRFLCFIDFQTTQGADDAMRAVHDTEVKGRLVHVMPSQLAPWRAYQLGKTDKKWLERLQEKDLAPKVIDEERFNKPLVRRKSNQV